MEATMRQVASAAGVSVATASRALNGSDAVIAATKEHVLRVAAELDYIPNRLGRSLATGSTGNVGVILPDVTNAFYTAFLAELENRLGAHDIGVLIGDSHENLDSERRLVRRMLGQVDALLLVSPRLPDSELIAAARRRPVVLANRLLEPTTVRPIQLQQVALDIDDGFTQAAEHLHALGHRGITYINGPSHSWSGRQKRATLERACTVLGMTLTVTSTADPNFTGGRIAAADINLERCSAIVAFNDEVALGVLSALRDRRIEVPGHMSVVGCDDSLSDGMAWPTLTTVDSSSRVLGGLAAAAILEPARQEDVTVPSRLVIRNSTAAVRAFRTPT